LTLVAGLLAVAAYASETPAAKTMADLLAESKASDWWTPDPENIVYLELEKGRVIIELAPEFAPKHVANLRSLISAKYFDGLAILRAQDNYVVQWGDPNAEKPDARKFTAKTTLPPEFERTIDKRMEFTRLPDGDVYAKQVGFWRGFPVARDSHRTWLIHEYGMVGVGRDNPPESGSGAELYVVIGEAPRHLDRNVTLIGRVLRGMELLSSMPRGTAAMGFYEKPEERAPIKAIRLAADVPAKERTNIEILRTDTKLFQQLIESRRNRREPWFVRAAGRISIENVPLPVRVK
jgi:peptidylprolyl isomerase